VVVSVLSGEFLQGEIRSVMLHVARCSDFVQMRVLKLAVLYPSALVCPCNAISLQHSGLVNVMSLQMSLKQHHNILSNALVQLLRDVAAAGLDKLKQSAASSNAAGGQSTAPGMASLPSNPVR
jgi:hypothetical protein